MKSSLFLCIICTVCFSSMAQKFTLGPDIGTNLMMLNKNELGRNYHLGWYGGANTEYKFKPYFSLRSGVYFSHRKNYTESRDTTLLSILGMDPSSLGIPGADFNIYYSAQKIISTYGIEIPLLATYNYKGIAVFAGGYVNYLTFVRSRETSRTYVPFLQAFDVKQFDPDGQLSALLPPADKTEYTESTLKNNIRVWDFGAKAGISYEMNQFRVNFIYTYGIPDFRINRDGNALNPNRYYTFSINYNFGIGKSNSSRSSFEN